MNIPLLDLKAQYSSIKAEVDNAIQRVLDKAEFILGEEVENFEREFSAFCGARECVGVSSGTAALRLALKACDIGAGDEVVTTPFTFSATAEAILHCGAKPVFTDIDPRTYTINIRKLEEIITSRTKAILPVHLYGHPADMGKVLLLARERGLRVIEDAAQAHGAAYKGRIAGSLGDVGCFSFYPAKNLGAYGDAGAIITNNPEIAKRIRLLRDHGRSTKYEHREIGDNERLDALHAAVLRVKLNHLEEWNGARRSHAREYDERLAESSVETPYVADWARHCYHLYVIRSERRNELSSFLKTRGIGVGIHYPLPLHLQPAYAYLGYRNGDFPQAEKAASTVLSLPMFAELREDQIELVCDYVHSFDGTLGRRA